MSDRETQGLIEAATTAHRERDREGRILPPPAWWDLSPQDLDAVFEEQAFAREIERAIDSQGRSGTVRAVLERINRAGF